MIKIKSKPWNLWTTLTNNLIIIKLQYNPLIKDLMSERMLNLEIINESKSIREQEKK